MVGGARRIGKSTIVEEFAKQEYESYILIDFAKKDKVVEEYFNQYLNKLDDLFMLRFMKNIKNTMPSLVYREKTVFLKRKKLNSVRFCDNIFM